jgi:hypothetical protein
METTIKEDNTLRMDISSRPISITNEQWLPSLNVRRGKN